MKCLNEHVSVSVVYDSSSNGILPVIDKLYERYGMPDNILNNYFSALNTDEVIRKIRK